MKKKTIIFLIFTASVFSFVFIAKTKAVVEDQPLTPVNVFVGWKKDIAFNPDKNNYLVAVLSGNDIVAKLIDVNGNDVTQQIKINDPGDLATEPKIAYSPDIKKFLVVYAQLQGTPTSPTNPGHVYGRFVTDNGQLDGNDFDLTPEGGIIADLPDNSILQFDKTNKKFVLVYKNQATDVRLMTIDQTGNRVINQIVSPSTGTYQAGGSVAVSERSGEYCVIWSTEIYSTTNANAADVFARSVKASDGTLGPKVQLSTGPVYLPYTNIAWNSDLNNYLAIWMSVRYRNFTGQMFNGLWGLWGRYMDNCSSTPTHADFMISDELGTPSIAYNPTSHLFGIAGEATVQANNGMGNGEENNITYVDASGNIERGPQIFTDFGPTGNKNPFIVANINNGTFAVISTRDYRDTRFIGSLTSTMTPATAPDSFPTPTPITSPQGYPGIGNLIAQLLQWSIRILGIAVFIMTFYGGLLWFLSRGNSGQITQAKNKITNAILGAILLLSAYLILYTVNPDLVKGTFNLPGVGSYKR